MRNHLARNECCAALGWFGRLTGSLRFPRIGKTKNAFDQEQVASEQAPIFLFPLYSIPACAVDRVDTIGVHEIKVRVVRGCFSGSLLDSRQLQYHLFCVGLDRSRPA
jgi:hypothetical protein